MKERLFWFILLSLSVSSLFSQENNEESFKKTFRSELKTVESQLARKPNDVKLHYKYALLCFKLCRYREAQRALYKCMDQNKNNAQYYLDLYHIEIALKNKVQADEFYYKYMSLINNSELNKNPTLSYQELTSEIRPSLASKNLNSMEYFPFVLENDKLKFLTITKFTYLEPTSPLLFRNYLTNEVGFSNHDIDNPKIVTQPEKTSEGFSYSVFCLNKKQTRIYMTRYDGNNKRMIICVSDKEELSWGPFRTIQYIAKNPKYSFMHPMLTENEDQLIFTSDLKGGFGGLDLWIADLTENGDVKHVKNLGKKVNTIGNECFPTMYNQSSFFFSSDGHHGYGSLDIYKVDLTAKGTTSESINLGPSFNSSRDDYGLFYSQDKKNAFFTSNRSATNANLFFDKIYKIKLNVFDCEVLSIEIKNPFSKQEEIADQNRQIDQTNLSSAINPNTIEDSKSNSETEVLSNDNQQQLNTATNAMQSDSNQNSTYKEKEKIAEERVELHNFKGDKIEEKFVQYSDNVSIQSLNSNALVENKYWTTAQLIFKDFNLEIGYTYIRVINPKQEVVYSNYTSKNGMISVEVIENNEYTIEIPRFKTRLQGVVFSRNENTFYFPYNTEAAAAPKEVSMDKTKENTRAKVSKSTSIIRNKKKQSNTNLTKTTPSTKSKKPQRKSPTKEQTPQKLGPKNMIDNFS